MERYDVIRYDPAKARLDVSMERRAHQQQFFLWPRRWKEYPKGKVFRWSSKPLIAALRSDIPAKPGVYTIVIQPGIAGHTACSYVMYVGRASSLRNRFGNYITREKSPKGRQKLFELMNMYVEFLWFYFVVLENSNDQVRYEIEMDLWKAFVPPCNDMIPARPKRPRRAFNGG